MVLTDYDKKMFSGEYGTGVQKCKELLVSGGERFEAETIFDAIHVY